MVSNEAGLLKDAQTRLQGVSRDFVPLRLVLEEV